MRLPGDVRSEDLLVVLRKHLATGGAGSKGTKLAPRVPSARVVPIGTIAGVSRSRDGVQHALVVRPGAVDLVHEHAASARAAAAARA